MTDQEKVYLESNNVKITNSRAIFYSTTYALANITSVKIFKKPPSQTLPAIMFLGGAFVLIGGLCLGSSNTSGYIVAVLGVIAIGLGIFIAVRAKPDYIVKVSSASGEADVLKSKDKGYIQRIVDAVNQAIIERG